MNMEKKTITSETFAIKLYLAGDIQVAKQVCREETFADPLCVTVTPCSYIYTGGEEEGYVVGLLNYPRFPATPERLLERARSLAERLMVKGCQWSALIVSPGQTEWITRREDRA